MASNMLYRKGVRHFFYSLLIILTFLGVIYCFFGLFVLGFDFDVLIFKIKAMLLGRSIHFLFSRLGWCTGGLILAVIFSLVDQENVGNMMAPSGGEVTPYSDPSGPSSSSSWKEDSFEIQVLLEPFSETDTEGTSVNPPIPRVAGEEAGPSHQSALIKNSSLESSLQNRILLLEKEKTPFLLDKERGEYWSEIKKALDQAPSQQEYNRLLEFENRDLQIRELKHSCYSLFLKTLDEHPYLLSKLSNAPQPNPYDAILSFFDETREELENELPGPGSSHLADREEVEIYTKVNEDIIKNGPNSYYIKRFLGYFDDQDDGFT